MRCTALSISFISQGSCKSLSCGLKYCFAFSNVSMPLFAKTLQMVLLILSAWCKVSALLSSACNMFQRFSIKYFFFFCKAAVFAFVLPISLPFGEDRRDLIFSVCSVTHQFFQCFSYFSIFKFM